MDAVVRGFRVRPLAELLADELRDRAYRVDFATLIGERTPIDTQSWIDELAVAQLGARTTGALFASKSVGAVFALLLETGEPAVLKLFNRSYTYAELVAMHRCQRSLNAQGFPVASNAATSSKRATACTARSSPTSTANSATRTIRRCAASWRAAWRS